MRILYITEGFPYPLTSGGLRHYHLIRGLSPRHEISLMSTVGPDFRPEHVDAMAPFCSSVETFRSTARSSALRKAAARAGARMPGSDTGSRALIAAARDALAGFAPDVVLLSGRRTTGVTRHVGRTPLVVDLCDAVALRLSGQLRFSAGAARALLRLKLRRTRAAEATLIAAADQLLFASARDLESAMRHTAHPPPAAILPNGVDVEYWQRSRPDLGGEVVFSGAMHYPPNDDAARFLITSVMPEVWESRPDAQLRLIGLHPTKAMRRAAASARAVTVTGYVDDVRPHLEHGAVYAAPLRFGSGIQNKLLEALAMELPVVTSPSGAEGLRTADGELPPMTVAETAHQFAAAILDALGRAHESPTPPREGRAFVAAHFTWGRAVEIVERVLTDATGVE